MSAVIQVLFLCNDNSCRSVMAEALLNHLGCGKFHALSAGCDPAGQVCAKTLGTLQRHGIEPGDPVSKSWNNYSTRPFDLIITVCDQTATKPNPLFPGRPKKLFWNIPFATGIERADADFDRIFFTTRQHVERLIDSHNVGGG